MTAVLKYNLEAVSKTGSNVHLNMPAKFKNVLGVKLKHVENDSLWTRIYTVGVGCLNWEAHMARN